MKLVNPFIPPKELLFPRLEKVLYSGYIAEGESVYEFEKEMGMFIGNKNCIAVSSGTAALHIALMLIGLNYEDEIISTALTAEPTNVVIAQTGAKVVWADIDENTGLISPEDVEKKITTKTKAIMLVHYAGMVCDMEQLNMISSKYHIPIIEDAAHAFGAKYDAKTFVGNSNNYVAFSFQAIKSLTTVDGGMLFLPRTADILKAKKLRWFGLEKGISRQKTNISIVGYKYNMNNVTAEIGRLQLELFPKILEKYITNGKYYDKKINGIQGVQKMKYFTNTEPSYWLYTIRIKNRDEAIKRFEEKNIMASPLHKRNDTHDLFMYAKCRLPNLDIFCDEMLHIPCGWWINKKDQNSILHILENCEIL